MYHPGHNKLPQGCLQSIVYRCVFHSLVVLLVHCYGIKKDYIINRDIDLDKTFKHIVKPVFEELGYD